MNRPPPYVAEDGEVDYEQFVAAEIAVAKERRLGMPDPRGVVSTHHDRVVHKGQSAALEVRMVKTYTHYHQESMKKPKATARREAVIDVSALLPPGWTPQTPVSPTLTPRSPRSRAKGRSRPHPAARHRQTVAAPFLQGGSVSSAEDSLYSHNSLHSHHSSHLSQRSDALAAPMPSAAESPTGLSDAALRYLAEKRESFKMLMAFLNAALYVRTLRARSQARFDLESSAATVMQRWYRNLAAALHTKEFFANMRWPLMIIVQVRCWRKRKAADKIVAMLRDLEISSKHIQIKRAMVKIRHAQHVVKSFAQVCLARIDMLTRLWVREEARVRKLLLAKDRKREAALKRAAMKRNLEREASRKGHYNIHTIWAQRKEAVGLLMAHCDVVQQAYQKNVQVGDRARSRASRWRQNQQQGQQEQQEEQQEEQQQEQQQGGAGVESEIAPAADSQAAATEGSQALNTENDAPHPTEQAESEGEREHEHLHDGEAEAAVSPREREDAIRRAMISRRRVHVRLQERVAEKKKDHSVSEAQCRAFLLAPRADDSAALEVIDKILLGGDKVQAAQEALAAAPKAETSVFLCLTDPRLGPSWRQIIRDHVERDVKRKNQQSQKKAP